MDNMTQKKKELYVFLTAIVSMFITHYYFFANRFISYEDLVNSFVPRNLFSIGALDHGRWFLPVAQIFSSNWSMPQVSGLISGVVFGLTAILLVRIYEIHSMVLSVLLSVVLTTFPAVACFNGYTHQAETFVISICLATLAVYLVGRYQKYGFVFGGLVLCLSMGIYQSFVSYVVGLVYVIVVLACLQKDMNIKKLFQKLLPYVFMMGIGAALYVCVTKGLLEATGTQMVEYHNARNALNLSNINIAIGIKPMIVIFLQYYFSTVYNGSFLVMGMNLLAALLIAAVVVKKLIVNGKQKNWVMNLILLLVLAVIPFGINSLPVLLGNAALNGNGLRRYTFYCLVVTYVLFIVIVDRWLGKGELQGKMKKIVSYASVLILCVVCWCGYLQCNQAYTRANVVYESVFGYMNRILARAEQVEGWDRTVPVYFAKNTKMFGSFYEEEIEEFDDLFDMEPLQLQGMYDQVSIANFWRIYLHMEVENPSEEQINKINEMQEYKDMPAYPAEDSVKILDGVLVIKMDE